MQVTLTNREVVALHNGLSRMKSAKMDARVAYAIVANKNRLAAQVKIIQEFMDAADPQIVKYEKERYALLLKHAMRRDGEEVVQGDKIAIADPAKFSEGMAALNSSYAPDIGEKIEAYDRRVEVMYAQSSAIELVKVDVGLLPPMSVELMTALMPMISEPAV